MKWREREGKTKKGLVGSGRQQGTEPPNMWQKREASGNGPWGKGVE